MTDLLDTAYDHAVRALTLALDSGKTERVPELCAEIERLRKMYAARVGVPYEPLLRWRV